MVSEGKVILLWQVARQDGVGVGGWVGDTELQPPPPTEMEIEERHTDFVDTTSMVLRDLTLNQNQSVKSANGCYIGITINK
jgi:hypothetical protein